MPGVFGPNGLTNQQYQGQMLSPSQMGVMPGMPAMGINPGSSPMSFDSFSMQSQSMSFGGGMPGAYSPQVSGSTLQLMAQLNTMMASVMQGLMSFIQVLMSSIANRQSSSSTSGGQNTGINMAPSESSPPSGSGLGSKAVDWALEEEKKGISEAKDKSYILKNYTKGTDMAWCAAFVSTALEKSGGSPFGFKPAVKDIRAWGQENNRYIEKGKGTPKKGDVIIFEGAGASHTGLVVKVENGKVYTIEGNTSDAVHQRNYSLDDAKISGYVQVD